MADELSPQQSKELKDQVKKANDALEKEAEKLKDTPDNVDTKRELAKKLGAAQELLVNFKLGVVPTPERAADLLDELDSNINVFIRVLKAVIEAIKVVIQGIIDILKTLVDGIKSLFPKQETETAYLGDNRFEIGGISTFAMLADPTPPDGILVIPPAFAGVEEPIKARFQPAVSVFAVRSTPGERFRCFRVESLLARSAQMEIEGVKLPAFDQMLDPRKPSGGTLDLESGLVSGELYTTLFDGRFYRPQSPIFVRSKFTGTYSRDTGMLHLSTRAIDVASSTPFLQMMGNPC